VTGIQEADEALTITFLRNPVSRVISYCQHVSEGKSPHLRREFPPETFDLDAFLRSGNVELANLQTRMLIEDQSTTTDPLGSMTPSAARDTALENLLNRVFRFGLQELFDESLLIFADALGWSLPLYAHLNKKNPRKLLEVNQHHIDQIRELNAIDLEVYARARGHFCDNLVPTIAALQVQRFGRMQRLAAFPLLAMHYCTELLSARRG